MRSVRTDPDASRELMILRNRENKLLGTINTKAHHVDSPILEQFNWSERTLKFCLTAVLCR